MRLRTAPISLAEANAYTVRLHRHNGALPAAKFCIAVVDEDAAVHGVAVVGIPKARMLHDGWTLEVNRVCTDGAANACSALYGACARVARELGYRRIVTYTLQAELGASLRAAGWLRVAEVDGESWTRRNTYKGNPGYVDQHDTGDNWRWEITWPSAVAEPLAWPAFMTEDDHPSPFGEAS